MRGASAVFEGDDALPKPVRGTMSSMKSIYAAVVATVLGAPAAKPRVVNITVSGDGFSPAEVRVAKDEPTTLLFKRTTDSTCAKEVAFPDLGLKKALPLNESVPVEVPVTTARTLTFQCGMGMFKSAVVIH
jgi:plastocyanin domain-containing protein